MVIQRIQSVYLLIVSILMAIYSFMDVVLVQTATSMEKLSLFNAGKIPFILSVLVAVISFLTIFKYKKMNLQITLSSACILLMLTQVVLLVVEVYSMNYSNVEFFICNCMPVLAVIFLGLAIAAIKRDKKILSGYDRLR